MNACMLRTSRTQKRPGTNPRPDAQFARLDLARLRFPLKDRFWPLRNFPPPEARPGFPPERPLEGAAISVRPSKSSCDLNASFLPV